jgi:hypothetical protein
MMLTAGLDNTVFLLSKAYVSKSKALNDILQPGKSLVDDSQFCKAQQQRFFAHFIEIDLCFSVGS